MLHLCCTLWKPIQALRLPLLVACLACKAVFVYSQPAVNLFDASHTRRFALHLYRQGHYDFAASALREALSFFPTDDSLQLLLLRSYRKSAAWQPGIAWVSEQTPPLSPNVEAEYIKLLIQSGQHLRARDALRNARVSACDQQLLQSALLLHTHQWQAADSLLRRPCDNRMAIYSPIVAQAQQVRYVSPGVSMALSAVVPGAGQVYAHQWQDGLASVLLLAGCGWQAMRGYRNQGWDSPRVWIFGTAGMVLYSANLYGARQAAFRYNNARNRELQEAVRAASDRIFDR